MSSSQVYEAKVRTCAKCQHGIVVMWEGRAWCATCESREGPVCDPGAGVRRWLASLAILFCCVLGLILGIVGCNDQVQEQEVMDGGVLVCSPLGNVKIAMSLVLAIVLFTSTLWYLKRTGLNHGGSGTCHRCWALTLAIIGIAAIAALLIATCVFVIRGRSVPYSLTISWFAIVYVLSLTSTLHPCIIKPPRSLIAMAANTQQFTIPPNPDPKRPFTFAVTISPPAP